MKKFIQSYKVWLLAGLVFVLFSISLILAMMTKSTPQVQNEFMLAEVECKIHESLNLEGGTTDNTDAAVHTGVVSKADVKVENASNIDAYIRVRLVAYYVDDDDNVVGKVCSVPTFVPNNSYWIADSDEDTYYYKYPVAAGQYTEDLIASGSVIELAKLDGTDTDTYEHLYQVVDVIAEAVQAEPASAVTSVWNVSVNDDGTLTK